MYAYVAYLNKHEYSSQKSASALYSTLLYSTLERKKDRINAGRQQYIRTQTRPLKPQLLGEC